MLKHNSTNVYSNTPQLATGWPYRWFSNFCIGFAKSPSMLRSFWILNECNLYFKIVKYCILSEVCMIKTAPYSTVLPRMWCIKRIKCWFTRPQIRWQDFVKQTCRTQKIRPDLFSRPNLLWSRAIMAIKYCWTVCKIFFSKIICPLHPSKVTWMCSKVN